MVKTISFIFIIELNPSVTKMGSSSWGLYTVYIAISCIYIYTQNVCFHNLKSRYFFLKTEEIDFMHSQIFTTTLISPMLNYVLGKKNTQYVNKLHSIGFHPIDLMCSSFNILLLVDNIFQVIVSRTTPIFRPQGRFILQSNLIGHFFFLPPFLVGNVTMFVLCITR